MKKIGGILCVLGMVFSGFVLSASETHAQLLNNNSSNSGYDTYYSNPGGTVGVGKYSGSDTGYTRTDFSTYDVPSSTTKSSATTASSSGSGSSADNGKIFRILESKIYDTLMDLREIVYMIAGFGLVMFTVMAIFNKISYKHLGYIMIGLSLLALMFPFIEYFSGYTTEALRNQRELTFRSFLDPNVSMERIQGTGYKEIVYPSYQGEVPSDVSEGGLSDEELASLQNQPHFELPEAQGINLQESGIKIPDTIEAQVPDINRAIYEAGCDPLTMKGKWDEKTLQRLVCSVDEFGNVLTTYEVCEGGKIKNGTCKATLLTTLNNITQGTQAALSTVSNATGAIVTGIGTAMATYEGAKNIVEAVENAQWSGDDFMDTVNNIYGSTQGVLSTINRENNIIAGGIVSTTQQIGNTMDGTSTLASLFNTDYENNPTGANSMTNWWGATDEEGNRTNNLYNTLGGISDTTGDIQNAVAIGTGTLGTVAHDTYGIIGTVDQFSQDMGLSQSNAAKLAEQAAAEQQAAAEAAAAEAAAQRALLEAQNRAAEEEMRRAQEEALRQEQQRQAQMEAERRAAEEEMRRAQNTKAAETAMDNLTMDQLASYVQSGQITFEQALSLAMAQEARKAQAAQQTAQQAQEAMQSAQEEYNQALENANQANAAVEQAEEKVKNADGVSLMSALVDLNAAQQAASDAQEAADKAKTAYDSAQKTYSNAQKTYENQQTKAEQAETNAGEELKNIMSNATSYDNSESGDDTGGAGADGSGASS